MKGDDVMIERIFETKQGNIHYWVNIIDNALPTLVFLPGLTADYRLFDKQIEYFEGKYNVFVWDAPGHGKSWPFEFDFDLMDKTKWLYEILVKEHIEKPVAAGHIAISPFQKNHIPQKLDQVTSNDEIRFTTGMGELNRVLGGGAVAGSLILIGSGVNSFKYSKRLNSIKFLTFFLKSSQLILLILYSPGVSTDMMDNVSPERFLSCAT